VLGRQPQAQGQGQPAAPARSPRGQPANLGRGSAPRSSPSSPNSQQRDVLDTLFG
jgi:hypothetical protein